MLNSILFLLGLKVSIFNQPQYLTKNTDLLYTGKDLIITCFYKGACTYLHNEAIVQTQMDPSTCWTQEKLPLCMHDSSKNFLQGCYHRQSEKYLLQSPIQS